jgi:hypothetical protein
VNWRIIFVIVVISVAGVVFYMVHSASQKSRRVVPAHASEIVEPESVAAAPSPESVASNELARIREWVTENPMSYDEAASRFENLAENFSGTACAKEAAELADAQRSAKELAVKMALDELNQEVAEFEQRGEYTAALKLMEEYSGPFEDETHESRAVSVQRIRTLIEEAQKQQQQHSAAFEKALGILLTQGCKELCAFTQEHKGSLPPGEQSQEWSQLVDAAERADRLGESVLESFNAQRGEEIPVDLKSGRMRLQIAGAKEGMILYYAKVGRVRVTKKISLSQLSESELESRVGEDAVGLHLFRLSAAAMKKDYGSAKAYIEKLPSPLRESIQGEIEKSAASSAMDAAWNQLAGAIFKAGVSVRGIESDPVALLAAVKGSERSDGMNLLLHAVARDLAVQYRDTEWIKDQGVVKLINFMYELKPEEGSGVPPEAGDEVAEEITDWKKEIDF